MQRMSKIVGLGLLVLICILTIVPTRLSAQEDKPKKPPEYTLLEPLPCLEGTSNDKNCTNKSLQTIQLSDYVNYIYKFSFAFAVFLAVIMIIYGGFEWMLSDSFTKKDDAKSKISGAVWGLIGIFVSYTILKTIDPRLVQINTTIPNLDISIADTIKAQKDFESSLKNLDNVKAELVNKTIDKLGKEQQRVQELENIVKNPNTPPAEIEKDKKELETLKESVTNDKSTIWITTGSGNLQRTMNAAMQTLENLDSYSTTFALNSQVYLYDGKDVEAGIAKDIKTVYDSVYNQLNEVDKQKFDREANFIKDQVKEEENLGLLVAKYKKKNDQSAASELRTLYTKYSGDAPVDSSNNDLNEFSKAMYAKRKSFIETTLGPKLTPTKK